MTDYALVDSDGAIIRQQTFDDHPPDPIGKRWAWLKKIEGETPAFNRYTERVVATYQIDRTARTITRLKEVQALSAEAVAETLANRKAEMAVAIDDVWELKTYAGFAYDFGGEIGVKVMQTRQEDQARWLALKDACNDAIIAGVGDQSVPISLRPADNSSVPVTFNEAATMLRAMRSQQMGLLAYSWVLKNAVAAADHAALDKLDIHDGWPA